MKCTLEVVVMACVVCSLLCVWCNNCLYQLWNSACTCGHYSSACFGMCLEQESEVFGWSQSQIPNNTGNQNQIFFVRLWLQMSNWIIFTSH